MSAVARATSSKKDSESSRSGVDNGGERNIFSDCLDLHSDSISEIRVWNDENIATIDFGNPVALIAEIFDLNFPSLTFFDWGLTDSESDVDRSLECAVSVVVDDLLVCSERVRIATRYVSPTASSPFSICRSGIVM